MAGELSEVVGGEAALEGEAEERFGVVVGRCSYERETG